MAYPPVLALTSLHDTRVMYRRAGEMGCPVEGGRPRAVPVPAEDVMDGGHGGVSGRYETWKERAYEMAWVLDVLGVEPAKG